MSQGRADAKAKRADLRLVCPGVVMGWLQGINTTCVKPVLGFIEREVHLQLGERGVCCPHSKADLRVRVLVEVFRGHCSCAGCGPSSDVLHALLSEHVVKINGCIGRVFAGGTEAALLRATVRETGTPSGLAVAVRAPVQLRNWRHSADIWPHAQLSEYPHVLLGPGLWLPPAALRAPCRGKLACGRIPPEVRHVP